MTDLGVLLAERLVEVEHHEWGLRVKTHHGRELFNAACRQLACLPLFRRHGYAQCERRRPLRASDDAQPDNLIKVKA